jgi:hypothetical protein
VRPALTQPIRRPRLDRVSLHQPARRVDTLSVPFNYTASRQGSSVVEQPRKLSGLVDFLISAFTFDSHARVAQW